MTQTTTQLYDLEWQLQKPQVTVECFLCGNQAGYVVEDERLAWRNPDGTSHVCPHTEEMTRSLFGEPTALSKKWELRYKGMPQVDVQMELFAQQKLYEALGLDAVMGIGDDATMLEGWVIQAKMRALESVLVGLRHRHSTQADTSGTYAKWGERIARAREDVDITHVLSALGVTVDRFKKFSCVHPSHPGGRDNRPSASVLPGNRYMCFVCNTGGKTIDLVVQSGRAATVRDAVVWIEQNVGGGR